MRKKRRTLWERSFLSLAVSSALGCICLLAAAAILSVFALFFISEPRLLRAVSFIPVVTGAYTAGFFCGKHRRRKGLLEGSICGVFIYLVLAVFGLVFTGTLPRPGKLLILIIAAALGGVVGTNRRLDRYTFRSHDKFGIRN